MSLFDDDGDNSNNFSIKVNDSFAEKYAYKKKREELSRLKDKFGEEPEEEESSSSESEDSDAELLTPAIDKDIFKTLSLIKAKDPSIYNPEVKFFDDVKESDDNEDDDGENDEKNKTKKAKSVTLRDYERQQLLEKGAEGAFQEDESDEERKKSSNTLSYVEQQAQLKDAIKLELDAQKEDSDDDLFTTRVKTQSEKDKEEEDYLQWLADMKDENNKKAVSEMITLKRYWQNPELDENEKFLRDYVLGRKWEDKEEDEESGSIFGINPKNNVSDDDEDLESVENQERFEKEYNFRFEEEGSSSLKSYGRNQEDSVRNKSEKRKAARARKLERKAENKLKKQEELKRMKSLKRQEILEKLKEIKEISGVDADGFENLDIEGEWDEKAHEAQMEQMFSKDFYDDENDDKPVFDDNDEDLSYLMDANDGEEENKELLEETEPIEEQPKLSKRQLRKLKKQQEAAGFLSTDMYKHEGDEDLDFNMDADYVEEEEGGYMDDNYEEYEYVGEGNKGNKRKKEKQEMKKMMKNTDAQTKEKLDSVLDEYYKLDFEDMIDDLPVRFNYRKVIPNDYGLSATQILKADDKELNNYVSLRKMTKYRDDRDEFFDKKKYSEIPLWKKRKVLPSAFASIKDKQEEEDNHSKDSHHNNNSHKHQKKNSKTNKKDNNNDNAKPSSDNKKKAQPEKAKEQLKRSKKGNDDDEGERKSKKSKQDDEGGPSNSGGAADKDDKWDRKAFNERMIGESRLSAYDTCAGIKQRKHHQQHSKSSSSSHKKKHKKSSK